MTGLCDNAGRPVRALNEFRPDRVILLYGPNERRIEAADATPGNATNYDPPIIVERVEILAAAEVYA